MVWDVDVDSELGTVPGGLVFRSRLGTMLMDRGLITGEQLGQALELQRSTGMRLGEALVENGAVSGADLTLVLAEHLGLPFVDVRAGMTDVTLAGLISEDVARRYEALPVVRWGARIVVAMARPNDVFALDDLRLLINEPIMTALADPEELSRAIDRVYQGSEISARLDDATADYGAPEDEMPESINAGPDGSMVRLLNALLDQAVNDRASDVHIAPSSRQVEIRCRIDGVLRDVSQAPLSVLRPLLSRLKIVAGMDIAQSRLPQDGRFSVASNGRHIDVRVATVPTTAGEAATLRLLDSARGTLDLATLGLTDRERDRFEPAFRAPQGGVLVTGPTGSGKTSTLYAVLEAISTRDKNIVSVEDPAECVVDGVKQIEINVRAGLTFPSALRAILRSDPDVIMIGEVRDVETARIAAEAAITGHLVLATLHTTSAAATAMRLIDMGIEPYLVAASLTCIVAQRLTRNLCEHCAETDGHGLTRLRDLGADESILNDARPRKPHGCASCRNTGYQGRSAVYEVMPIGEDLARLIVERASTADIESTAIAHGMDTLRVAALRRAATGQLSIDELLRTIL
jgi:type IV pilus assembly protein PilB